jgi:DNA-binding transcriptional LysR family regulator
MPLDPDYALFAQVVSARSLAGAARQLRISPPMVSKRLARLEERLGTRLIHRTTRKLSLTASGENFYKDIEDILAAVKTAEDRVMGVANEPSGPLRVSVPTSFGRLHIAPKLGAFLAAYPRIELEVDLSDRYVDMVAERIDVGVRITAEMPRTLDATRLADNRRLLTASPAYIAQHGQPHSLDALARHRLLAAEGQLPWHLVSKTRRESVRGQSFVKTNSSELVRELAIAGAGVALRSLWDVSADLREGRLMRVLPDWEGSKEAAIYAIKLRGTGRLSAADAFVAFLQGILSPVPWEMASEQT